MNKRWFVAAAFVAAALALLPSAPAVESNTAAPTMEELAPVDTLACVSPELIIDFNAYGISEEVLYGCGVFDQNEFSLVIPVGGIPAPSYDAWFSGEVAHPGQMVAVFVVKYNNTKLYATALPLDVAEHYLDPDIVGEDYVLERGLPGGVALEVWDGVERPHDMRREPLVALLS